MHYNPAAIVADDAPDAASVEAITAALRDFARTVRQASEHPRRPEMREIMSDVKARIERING